MSWITKAKYYLLRIALIPISMLVALLIGEGACRLIYNRVDYLKPVCVEDEMLGTRIAENSSGHDAWGFRNVEVPEQAEIVAIGDSQTYGVAACAHNSWPSQLEHITGRRVYNLGMSGYGPVQYQHLLGTRALTLHPKVVIVALYFGNDMLDAWDMAYCNKAWQHLRDPKLIDDPSMASEEEPPPPTHSYMHSIREWFARHSVLYRRVNLTPLGDKLHMLEARMRGDVYRPDLLFAQVQDAIMEFTPIMRLHTVDPTDPRVMEGLRISLQCLKEMKVTASAHCKEQEVVTDLLQDEETLANKVLEQCLAMNIECIDLYPTMAEAAMHEIIYPIDKNGHPNRRGYRVIAKTIAAYLNSSSNPEQVSGL